MPTAAIAALQRLRASARAGDGARAATAALEICELCAAPLAPRHEHLLDLGSRQLACACTACALLFDSGAPSAPRRRLPRDSRFLNGFDLAPAEWAALDIPVNLAFVSYNSRLASMTAAYPSPAGAVTATIPDEIWAPIVRAHPPLASLAPDVEAILLNRMQTPHQTFMAPLDQCYRLTGIIRASWSGFTGGAAVKSALAEFCRELRQGAREVNCA